MKELICFLSVFLAAFGHSATKPKLMIEQFGNVVRFFNTATLCEHKCDAKARFDNEGRQLISFKTNLKPNESDGNFLIFLKHKNLQILLRKMTYASACGST